MVVVVEVGRVVVVRVGVVLVGVVVDAVVCVGLGGHQRWVGTEFVGASESVVAGTVTGLSAAVRRCERDGPNAACALKAAAPVRDRATAHVISVLAR